jgi:DNA-binding CsgD family transcriptional regulator
MKTEEKISLNETIFEILKIKNEGRLAFPESDEEIFENLGFQPREVEVMKLRLQGLSYKQVGQHLKGLTSFQGHKSSNGMTEAWVPERKIGDPISSSRVQQIVKKVFRKLNHPSRKHTATKWKSKLMKKWIIKHKIYGITSESNHLYRRFARELK